MLKFSNNDINKFILLLRKGVYPFEYTDDWEKFDESTLPEKKNLVVTYTQMVLEKRITSMKKEFVKALKKKTLENIMICILEVMHYFYLMFLRTLEICV